MPVMEFNEKLPSVYLERFNPPVGVPCVISVLATRSIALEYHWIDLPTLGIKGKYKCCGGICCQAFGTRIQSYNIPIWVYTNPRANSPEGQLMVWQVSPTLYKQITTLGAQFNLLQYDLMVTKEQQGQGTRTNITAVPTPQLRAYMTPEKFAEINADVEAYFTCGEDSLAQTSSEQEIVSMLQQAGYDFQNRCFPQLGYQNNGFGHKPFQPLGAPQGAIGGMMSPPNQAVPQSLPPVPPVPPQPVPPQPAISTGSPARPVTGSPVQPAITTGSPAPAAQTVIASQVPPAPVPPPQPQPVQPAPVPPVPPQPAAFQAPPQPAAPVAQPNAYAPPPNQVGQATEVSATELEQLLDDD